MCGYGDGMEEQTRYIQRKQNCGPLSIDFSSTKQDGCEHHNPYSKIGCQSISRTH